VLRLRHATSHVRLLRRIAARSAASGAARLTVKAASSIMKSFSVPPDAFTRFRACCVRIARTATSCASRQQRLPCAQACFVSHYQ
jgi:hypothetical protein